MACPARTHGRDNPAARRLATAIEAMAQSPTDVPTVEAWATLLRLSRRTLEYRCRAAGARPKDALALGRLLRALTVGEGGVWCPEQVLDVLDHRTVESLLTRAGVVGHWHGRRPAVRELLADHALEIPTAVGHILAARLASEHEPRGS